MQIARGDCPPAQTSPPQPSSARLPKVEGERVERARHFVLFVVVLEKKRHFGWSQKRGNGFDRQITTVAMVLT